jgi:hypothetical protein
MGSQGQLCCPRATYILSQGNSGIVHLGGPSMADQLLNGGKSNLSWVKCFDLDYSRVIYPTINGNILLALWGLWELALLG